MPLEASLEVVVISIHSKTPLLETSIDILLEQDFHLTWD